MSDETARLHLSQLVSLQELNAVTWNEALAMLDALVDLYLLGQFVNTPPSSPQDGDAYLIGGAPTGAWSGYPYKIASCLDGSWRFYVPFNGLRAYVAASGAFVVYLNGVWADVGSLTSANEVPIASAAICDLGATGSLFVQITGNTTIASFGTGINKLRHVRFAQALTLTHNPTSLILLGAGSRATAAGDVGVYSSDGSGNWRERAYFRAISNPGDLATKTGIETLSNKTFSGAVAFPGGTTISATGLLSVCTAVGTYGATISGSIGAIASTSGSAATVATQNDTGANSQFVTMGSARPDVYFGQAAANGSFLLTGTSTILGVGSYNNVPLVLGTHNIAAIYIDTSQHVLPGAANTNNLGSASRDWANGWIRNAWTVTSDRSLKTNFRGFSDAELAAAAELLDLVCLYQWRDSVATKGVDKARIHSGIPAQDAMAVLRRHGLDPGRYGWFCSDPVIERVRHTRKIQRQAMILEPVLIEEWVEENGCAVRKTRDTGRTREVLQWQNQRFLAAKDAAGNPVVEDGQEKRIGFADPVMEEVDQDYFEDVPVTGEDGAQQMHYAIRYADLHNWLLAALWQRIGITRSA